MPPPQLGPNLLPPAARLAPRHGELWLLRAAGPLPRAALSVLDDGEAGRMNAFVRPADRLRYAFAHVALRTLLGARLGAAPGTLRFARDLCPCCGEPHGRPVLADRPDRTEFSLSHGGDLVMVGVAAATIGVDVEPVGTGATALSLAARLHPAERRAVEAARPDGAARAFTGLWVRKEAYLKGLGTGLARDLAADDLTAPIPGWSVAEVPAGAGDAAAYAIAR